MFKISAQIALITVALMGCEQASAATYVLVDQQYGGNSAERDATLALSLTVSDQAVQRGIFSLNENVSSPSTNFSTGDISDFGGLSWTVGPADSGFLSPLSGAYTDFVASLTFVNGVPSGTLHLNGETSEFALSGVAGFFSGTIASDFNNCNDPQGMSLCTVAGRLDTISSVPEPNVMTILAVGLLAACSARRRAL